MATKRKDTDAVHVPSDDADASRVDEVKQSIVKVERDICKVERDIDKVERDIDKVEGRIEKVEDLSGEDLAQWLRAVGYATKVEALCALRSEEDKLRTKEDKLQTEKDKLRTEKAQLRTEKAQLLKRLMANEAEMRDIRVGKGVFGPLVCFYLTFAQPSDRSRLLVGFFLLTIRLLVCGLVYALQVCKRDVWSYHQMLVGWEKTLHIRLWLYGSATNSCTTVSCRTYAEG